MTFELRGRGGRDRTTEDRNVRVDVGGDDGFERVGLPRAGSSRDRLDELPRTTYGAHHHLLLGRELAPLGDHPVDHFRPKGRRGPFGRVGRREELRFEFDKLWHGVEPLGRRTRHQGLCGRLCNQIRERLCSRRFDGVALSRCLRRIP